VKVNLAQPKSAGATHEEAVIKAFMLPNRQERFLALLSNPKRRREFTDSLAHFRGLNPKFVQGIPKNCHDAPSTAGLLKQHGAGRNCWVISENSSLDSREMDLDEALRQIRGYEMGTIVSCIPGRLAYFEDEDIRCIVLR
jgi:hypothetical protein